MRRLAGISTCLLALSAAVVAAAADPLGDTERSFTLGVLPLLKSKCFACHGSESVEGGLRLDVRRRAMLGGDSGSTIVARAAKDSELIARITTDNEERRMPADEAPLSAREVPGWPIIPRQAMN